MSYRSRSRSRERAYDRQASDVRHYDDYSRSKDDQTRYRERDEHDRRGGASRHDSRGYTDTRHPSDARNRDRSRSRTRQDEKYRERDRDYEKSRGNEKDRYSNRTTSSPYKDKYADRDKDRGRMSREEALNLPRAGATPGQNTSMSTSTSSSTSYSSSTSSSSHAGGAASTLTEQTVSLAAQALEKLAVSETCFLTKSEREALAAVRSVKGERVTVKDLVGLGIQAPLGISGEKKSGMGVSLNRENVKQESMYPDSYSQKASLQYGNGNKVNSSMSNIANSGVFSGNNDILVKKKSSLAVLSLAASQKKNIFAGTGISLSNLTGTGTGTGVGTATAGNGGGLVPKSTGTSGNMRDGKDGNNRGKSQERLQMDIKRHYLGKDFVEQLGKSDGTEKPREKPKSKYQFEWDLTHDTMSNEYDPIYQGKYSKSGQSGSGRVGSSSWEKSIPGKKKSTVHDDALAFVSEEERERRMERENRNKAKYEAMVVHSRHWREKSLPEMDERDWRIFREDFSITTRGTNVPRPLRFWEEAELPPALMDAIAAAGYKEPSPIQRAALPVGLSNRDIIGVAETGSGKTAAFLLPLLCYVMKQPKLTTMTCQDGPYAIVMAPARELAQQIHEEAEKFGKYVGVRTVCVVGGQNVHDQATKMSVGVEVVIATPGRLFDLLQQRLLVLNQCNYIVLDEADRMLDMGFEPQIQAVMDSMPATNMRPIEDTSNKGAKHFRQTIMFSATMPFKVEQLAKKYLRNPVFVTIGGRAGKTADRVEQKLEWTTDSGKRSRLSSVLSQWDGPIIIFCNHKKTCDYLSKMIQSDTGKHKPCVIHSGKSQDDREAGLAGFKDGKYSVLITTDVMGRGIDVSGVKLVINYELPQGPQAIERYTHRIGRTGRGGQKGTAISFITEEDTEIMYDLKKLLTESGVPVPSQLAHHPSAKRDPRLGDGNEILW